MEVPAGVAFGEVIDPRPRDGVRTITVNATLSASGHGPATVEVREALGKRFNLLRDQWLAERPQWGNLTDLSMHSAYQLIIGMGRTAIPFILQELERKPDHWFWALHAITGENPVSKASEGKLHEMAADWVEWGRGQEFIN